MVVDLPRDIRDVLVADPKIANAVVRSSRRAYIIGTAVGQTNVFFFDTDGKQIGGFDIAVTRDLNGIRAAIRQVLPDADITVEGIGDGVMLAGSASSPIEAQQAYDIAVRLAGDGSKVVNAIMVRGRDQIMLKVTVAEVERDVIKQLGINLSGTLNYGTAVVNFNNTNPFSAYGQSLTGSSIAGTFKNVTATLQAMEQAGVIHTLAEPNLTAISGEVRDLRRRRRVSGAQRFQLLQRHDRQQRADLPAVDYFQEIRRQSRFHAGRAHRGPHQPQGHDRSIGSVDQERADAFRCPARTNTVTVPSIHTRRAETTVEIPSGGSLAMAGMIQNQTKQIINGLPGLMELPVLGPLFKSRDYVNQQTELMVLVTPYVVRAVAQKDLSRPDDGFADPSDPASGAARPAQPHLRRRRRRRSRPTTITANTASFSTDRCGDAAGDDDAQHTAQ